MKNFTINVGSHKAVIRFKRISLKDFTKLRWALVEKNISEITEDCFAQHENTKNISQNSTSNK